MRIVIFVFVFIFSGCSLKESQQNVWIKNSSNSFESYTNYFLKGENRLALVSLKRAIKSAKSSANLKPLAKIYLGVCALNNSVLIKDKCEGYLSILDLLDRDQETLGYYNMLQKRFDKVEIKYLPEQYRDFVGYIKKDDYKKAILRIRNMKNITSMLISASLVKDSLKKDDVDFIINKLSSYGYKKALINWLKYAKKLNSPEKNIKIDRVLSILK